MSDTPPKNISGKIKGEYERAYNGGILAERRTSGGNYQAYEAFREAMHWSDKADAIRPTGNDDAVLRWNTCARMIAKNQLTAREGEYVEPLLE